MWSLISRLFVRSKRRAVRSYSGTTGVLEARQMLSAAASAPTSVVSSIVIAGPFADFANGIHNSNGVTTFVATSTTKGSEVGTFRVYGGNYPDGSLLQVTLSGMNSQAFSLKEISSAPGVRVYSIQVANARLARQGSSFELTVTMQTTPAYTTTQRFNIVKASEQTITVSENPTDGQLLGRLPARLRAGSRPGRRAPRPSPMEGVVLSPKRIRSLS